MTRVEAPVKSFSTGRTGRGPIPVRVPDGVILRVSPDGFWNLCAANRDLRLELTAEGVLTVRSPAGSESGRRNASLSGQLYVWATADGRGVVFNSNAGFTLPDGAVRAPDASWIDRRRWNAIRPAQRKRFALICPDFVAELLSPSDTRSETQAKLRGYVDQGALLGWLIDPESGEVETYGPGRPVELLKSPKTLSGEDVLPGFLLDLTEILSD